MSRIKSKTIPEEADSWSKEENVFEEFCCGHMQLIFLIKFLIIILYATVKDSEALNWEHFRNNNVKYNAPVNRI